jgi:hypothetical protein
MCVCAYVCVGMYVCVHTCLCVYARINTREVQSCLERAVWQEKQNTYICRETFYYSIASDPLLSNIRILTR